MILPTQNYIEKMLVDVSGLTLYGYLNEDQRGELDSFLRSALVGLVEVAKEKVEANRSSVNELESEMGAAYGDISVKVAFKEGFNSAVNRSLALLDNLLSGNNTKE